MKVTEPEIDIAAYTAMSRAWHDVEDFPGWLAGALATAALKLGAIKILLKTWTDDPSSSSFEILGWQRGFLHDLLTPTDHKRHQNGWLPSRQIDTELRTLVGAPTAEIPASAEDRAQADHERTLTDAFARLLVDAHRDVVDWADWFTRILATVAVKVGGIDELLYTGRGTTFESYMLEGLLEAAEADDPGPPHHYGERAQRLDEATSRDT